MEEVIKISSLFFEFFEFGHNGATHGYGPRGILHAHPGVLNISRCMVTITRPYPNHPTSSITLVNHMRSIKDVKHARILLGLIMEP